MRNGAQLVGLVGLVGVLIWASGGGSQTWPGVGRCAGTHPLRAVDFESFMLGPSARALFATAAMAVVHVQGETVRYRDDGPVPTPTAGTLIMATGPVTVCGPGVARIRLIGDLKAAPRVPVTVHYYDTP